MDRVLACIDAAPYTPGVCDHAAWAATRLGAPLQLLHVVDVPPELMPSLDFAGSLSAGAQESLLAELAVVDEQRARLAAEHGRLLLEQARQRVERADGPAVDTLQRHGHLVEVLLALEAETRLIVLGQHHHLERARRVHLEHNVERVIRALHKPVLVAAETFRAPQRFMVAFDGSPTARAAVERVAASPLLRGLPADVLAVGDDDAATRGALDWAAATLSACTAAVTTHCVPGDPDRVLVEQAQARGADLLVLGAYGHGRIRHLLLGATTTTVLRSSPLPVLVLR